MISYNRIMHLLVKLNKDEQEELIDAVICKAIKEGVEEEETKEAIEIWYKEEGGERSEPPLYHV